jgi:hypothetical protein
VCKLLTFQNAVHISTTIGVLGCHPSVAFYNLGGAGGGLEESIVQYSLAQSMYIELEIRRNAGIRERAKNSNPSC